MDEFLPASEWDFRVPLRTYESIASHPPNIGSSIVLARLINLKGVKALAKVLVQWEKTDKAHSPFGGKVPYYTGPVLQYIPLTGPMSYPIPDVEDGAVYFPGKLERGKDYVDAVLLPEGVIANLGTPEAESNPISQKLILRYTDPQGVVWKIRSYPKPLKGQTKPVLAWTDQYSEGDGDDIVEASFYEEIVSEIRKFQSTRLRKKPNADELSPVPMYSQELQVYLDNVPEVFDDGETVFKAYRVKDGASPRERNMGRFYAIGDSPSGVKIVGPVSKFSLLRPDVLGMKSQGRLVLDAFGPSSASTSTALRLSEGDDDGPKGLEENDLEEYLPWIGLGVGAIAVSSLLYMASRRRRTSY